MLSKTNFRQGKPITTQREGNTMEKSVMEQLAQMQAMLSEMAKKNAELEAKLSATKSGGSIKISEKGCVSVYGLGRFPVTLYRKQWLGLFDRVEEIKAFFEANKTKLDEVEASKAETKAKEQGKA